MDITLNQPLPSHTPNKDFEIVDNVLIKYNGSASNIVIPDNVIIIGKGVFKNSRIISVFMPDTITEIQEHAFYQCYDLKSMALSQNLKSIGRQAFWGAFKLKLQLPASIRNSEDVFNALDGCGSVSCSADITFNTFPIGDYGIYTNLKIIKYTRNPYIHAYKYIPDSIVINSVQEHFIAIDAKTTGSDFEKDKIIEIGAVLFEYGLPVKKFSSLINIKKNVSEDILQTHHITQEMLDQAPNARKVYREFVDFIGDALNGGIFICVYNIGLILHALERKGYSGEINYLNPLHLAQIKIPQNYRLETAATYYNIPNKNPYRAIASAEVYGNLLINLLRDLSTPNELIELRKKAFRPRPNSENICVYIKDILNRKGADTGLLRFKQAASGLTQVLYFYNFLEFKFSKKGIYFVISEELTQKLNIPTEPCTSTEGIANRRYYISTLSDIDILEDYIYKEYQRAKENYKNYISISEYRHKIAQNGMKLWTEY